MAQRPDLILAVSTPSVAAVWRIAGSIPIVFAAVSDPVGQHFIESLAHPGGTITGFTNFEPTMGGKWLELLKEIAPAVTYAGLIYNPSTAPNMNSFEGSFQSASSGLGVTLADMPVHDDAELDRAIASVGNEPNGGLVFPTDPFTNFRGRHTAELAASLRLPAIQPFKTFVEDGGLISYGTNISELYRRSASYIDRILRGARPADLPVQLPTKFELAINLKAARALGLNVSQVLLARADSVIE